MGRADHADDPLRPYDPDAGGGWTSRDATHLLWRARYGASPEEIQRATKEGLEGTLDRLLAPQEETAEFHLVRPQRRCPFVLALPILAGGESLMWIVATDLASRGFAVAWTRRGASALKPPQRGPELEQLFRTTVVHNRMVLAWARRQPDVDDECTGLLGISLGGMVAGALLAVEPDVKAGVVCLAGGDLTDILLRSDERRAIRWRSWRRESDDIATSELTRELDAHLVSDPARLGGYVDTDRVLLVAAALDTVVPMRNQNLLWESLGRPRRIVLPLAHYTSALALGTMLDATEGFLRERFEDGSALASADPDGDAGDTSPRRAAGADGVSDPQPPR